MKTSVKSLLLSALVLSAAGAHANQYVYRVPNPGLRAAVPQNLPALKLDISAWNFGQVAWGSFQDKSFTVSNEGAAPAALEFEPPAAPFNFSTSCGATLNAGTSCSLTLGYAGAVLGASSGTLRVITPETTLELELNGETAPPLEANVVRLGHFPSMSYQNLSTSPIHLMGRSIVGRAANGWQSLNLDTLVMASTGITANWRGDFGFPAGGAEVLQAYPHPTNSGHYVLVGDYSFGGSPTRSFVAIAQPDGKVIAAKYSGSTGTPAESAMFGNTVYVQSTNGGGAMTCTVQATAVNCADSLFGGVSPVVDDNGILHVRWFSMYGNDPRKVAYFPAGSSNAYTNKTVSGVSGDIRSIAFGRDGNLYATVVSSPAVWKIDRSTWQATVFAGSASESGDQGGSTSTARFGTTLYVQKSSNGLYVKDPANRRLYEIQL